MSKKANPKLIGGFVLGGLALLVVGLLAISGSNLFRERSQFVAYFPGSLAGLRVGAPVTFRGVPIGSVTDVKVLFNPQAVAGELPVVFELDGERIVDVGAERQLSAAQELQLFIERGLRAQLQVDSFVTGMLSVDLQFHPDAPTFEPVDRGGFALPYPEVPTLPSDMEQLQTDAGVIAQEISEALKQMNTILAGLGGELEGSEGRIAGIIDDAATFIDALSDSRTKLDQLLDQASTLLTETTETSTAVRGAVTTVGTILEDNQGRIATNMEQLESSAVSLARMADQINNAIAENRDGLRDFSQGGLYDISGLAQDAQRMVDQITRVMEELERDPARFLFGDRAQGIAAE